MDAKAYVNVNKLTDYYYDMAYEGKWHEALQYIADSYAKISSCLLYTSKTYTLIIYRGDWRSYTLLYIGTI